MRRWVAMWVLVAACSTVVAADGTGVGKPRLESVREEMNAPLHDKGMGRLYPVVLELIRETMGLPSRIDLGEWFDAFVVRLASLSKEVSPQVKVHAKTRKKVAPTRMLVDPVHMAYLYVKLGRYGDAYSLLKGVIEKEPSRRDARILAAVSLRNEGKNEECRKLLEAGGMKDLAAWFFRMEEVRRDLQKGGDTGAGRK